MKRTFLLPLLLVLASCGAATSETRDRLEAHDPLSLYPLLADSAWSYDVDTGDGESTLAISRVTTVVGSRVEVATGGEPSVYELRPEGIFRPASGTWLLHSPIAQGQTWPSLEGMTATVASIDERLETPAGNFTQCVRVEERNESGDKQISTVYCPRVGPVVVSSRVPLPASGEVRVEARLRGYTIAQAP